MKSSRAARSCLSHKSIFYALPVLWHVTGSLLNSSINKKEVWFYFYYTFLSITKIGAIRQQKKKVKNKAPRQLWYNLVSNTSSRQHTKTPERACCLSPSTWMTQLREEPLTNETSFLQDCKTFYTMNVIYCTIYSLINWVAERLHSDQ